MHAPLSICLRGQCQGRGWRLRRFPSLALGTRASIEPLRTNIFNHFFNQISLAQCYWFSFSKFWLICRREQRFWYCQVFDTAKTSVLPRLSPTNQKTEWKVSGQSFKESQRQRSNNLAPKTLHSAEFECAYRSRQVPSQLLDDATKEWEFMHDNVFLGVDSDIFEFSGP